MIEKYIILYLISVWIYKSLLNACTYSFINKTLQTYSTHFQIYFEMSWVPKLCTRLPIEIKEQTFLPVGRKKIAQWFSSQVVCYTLGYTI